LPIYLDQTDIAIIKSLVENGRKSFRQISRETKITTPTVKARYERLVNVGFIKGVLPIFDFNKIEYREEQQRIQIQNTKYNATKKAMNNENANIDMFKIETDKIKDTITTGIEIDIVCDFCNDPVFGEPHILKFADIERFFCCNSCKADYSEKYSGRIESIKKRYEGNSES
jgi:DNA-binding Lrp family transcriptional regulator